MKKVSSRPPLPKEPEEIVVPLQKNALLAQVLDLINHNEEILTLWKMTNVTAVNRLHMTDHGIQHFTIVANNALKLQRLLHNRKVKMSGEQDYKLTYEQTEVIVLLGALLHDIGMAVHRINHEEYSLFMANHLLHEILEFLPVRERTIIISETLHTIVSHRSDGHPLTLEAGIVRIADALDMSHGRSRFGYDPQLMDIHSVSALAIDAVEISAGRKLPIQVNIVMNHTAGIFQVDKLLQKEIVSSGLQQYLEIRVFIQKEGERELFRDYLYK